ncbi:rna-dependent dna polymerase [Lasius niger]|uniref:Rna-dependent dna polymerase n=1 Tax=Lasius niger TaxID=67767 RepID=A0A0J7K1J5_LASNI|nr:rna-dependent dna polymerase [Lasius niger]
MASYVKVDDVMIPIFDGADYANWKKRILNFFEFKKCKNPATRERTETDNLEEWNQADVKATNFIYSSITNKQLEYIGDLDSTYNIMKKFDEMYLKESTALQILCRNSLENVKLKDFTDVTSFFDEFEKAVNELKAAGGTISEQEKLRYMLKALPPSYSYVGDLIDVLPEKDRTVDYLKSKIKLKSLEEKNNKEQSDQPNSNAFSTDMRGKCFTCGKPGHKQIECQRGSTQQGRGRGHGRGQNRGIYHYNQRDYNRGYQRGGYSRGKSSNRGTPSSSWNHQGQHSANSNVFITEVNMSQTNCDNNRVNRENKINWILDSGCTDHIVNDDTIFDEYVVLKKPIDVKLGDGRILKATKIGNIKTTFQIYAKDSEVTLYNVFYVKEMKQNLISYSKVTEKNKIVSYGNNSKIYNQYKELIAIGKKEGNLYHMSSFVFNTQNKEVSANLAKKDKMTLKEKWHRALGHVNFHYLNKLCQDELLVGLPKELESDYIKCAICIESKMTNSPFENNRRRAKEILEVIHTDINGPHPTVGNRGEKYFLTFIDKYSKLAKVYCIKAKSETYDCFVEYVNLVENITGKRVKNLKCDNGKEYLNSSVYDFIKKKGIHMIPCPPYVHELNGVAERYNRSIMDMARCLLKEVKVNRMFWPEVIQAAAYLKNRTLANTIETKSPYEIFFNEKPNVKYLKIYGSRVFVRIPEQLRKSKWDDKAKLGILLGYTETGYRVLVNNKIINVRHVDVIEGTVKCIGLSDENEESDVEQSKENDIEENEVSEISQDENESHESKTPIVRDGTEVKFWSGLVRITDYT